MRFVLASASPARYETLVRAGVRPEVIVSDVDEDAVTADSASDLTTKLAALKAFDVGERLVGDALVLGCDSLLELDGEGLGKPGTIDAARERWQRMRGRAGRLLTGHCLYDVGAKRVEAMTIATPVVFADVTDAEIELYVSTGEPSNVAGAFTIDGFGGWFVDSVEGDPHNVVGVSLPALRTLLHNAGYTIADIGYPSV